LFSDTSEISEATKYKYFAGTKFDIWGSECLRAKNRIST